MKTPVVKMKRNSGGSKPNLIPIKSKHKDKQYIVRSGCRLDTEINRLWAGNNFIDVTLACDGHQFQCHRLIVAASSRLLENLLRSNTSNNPIVILPLGVKAPTMKTLIEFMYRGEIIVAEAELQELVESAQLLQVAGLYDPTTQFQEYFADGIGEPINATEKKQTICRRISQLDYNKKMEAKHKERHQDTAHHKTNSKETGSTNAFYNKPLPDIVDLSEIDETEGTSIFAQEIHASQNLNPVVASINSSTGTCEKGINTNPVSDANAKLLAIFNNRFNLITKNTSIPQNITIKPIPPNQSKNVPKVPPEKSCVTIEPAVKLTDLFDPTSVTQSECIQSQSNQGSLSTKLLSTNKIPWTYISVPISDDKLSAAESTRTQALATSQAGSINTQISNQQVPIQSRRSQKQRVPLGIAQIPLSTNNVLTTTKQVRSNSPKIPPLRLPLARLQAPYTFIKVSPSTTEMRPSSPQMPPLKVPPKRARVSSTSTNTAELIPSISPQTLPPLQNYSKLVHFTTQEMMPSPSQITETVATSAKSVPSFLKFNSSSMAISVKKLDRSKEEETLKVINMATEAEPEMEPDTKPTFLENCQVQENPLKTVVKMETETETMELGETSFTEADFPNFYAMMKKEKDELGVAQQVHEKDEQMLTEDEARAAIKMLTAADVEKIICQPNVSFYEDDDYNEDVESKVIDVETEMCIDYDRLVAEIYTEEEDDFKLGSPAGPLELIRQESDLDDCSPMFYPPDVVSLPKALHKRKHPPTLVPLSVMHSKQFHYSHKLNADEKSDINFKEELSSTLDDADLFPLSREGDPHSPNVVILRNPRCNQPRHYSTESLYNALMAVKYGESIYRASRLHDVPRKTLRNWMKRFGIKSVYPMPKQLKDAAKNTRKKQPATQTI